MLLKFIPLPFSFTMLLIVSPKEKNHTTVKLNLYQKLGFFEKSDRLKTRNKNDTNIKFKFL